MNQHPPRQNPRLTPDDEETATTPTRPRRPAGRPFDDGGIGPDEPGEPEATLIGDDDLGPADLGPAAPNPRDPDADSGRIGKIAR